MKIKTACIVDAMENGIAKITEDYSVLENPTNEIMVRLAEIIDVETNFVSNELLPSLDNPYITNEFYNTSLILVCTQNDRIDSLYIIPKILMGDQNIVETLTNLSKFISFWDRVVMYKTDVDDFSEFL